MLMNINNCLLANKDALICIKCNMDIFPFYSIEEDVEFIQTYQKTPQNELRTSTPIYNPLQSNEADYHIGSEFDPDINFYCEQNIFSGFLCKYSFNENLISFCSDYKLSFSLCHVNIRSLKANITNFENYLNMMNIDFSIIGVTETLLSDVTCNLYIVWKVMSYWKNRPNKMGGGVSLWEMVLIVNYAMIWQYLMTIVNLCLLKLTNQYLGQEGIFSLLLFIDHPTLIWNFLLMLWGCVRKSAARKQTVVLGRRL